MKTEFVAFDMAGTTVADGGVVIEAFAQAFQRTQAALWDEKQKDLMSYALETMGQSKIDVFTHLIGDAEQAQLANSAFESAYLEVVRDQGVHEIAGARDSFEMLRSQGIPVVLTTGFSRPTVDVLVDALGWETVVNLSVTPGEAGRGRPFPDMLKFAAEKLGVRNPSESIVLGDTVSDIEAGLAFGANQVVGVLTGAHTREMFQNAHATSVVNSVADLHSLL